MIQGNIGLRLLGKLSGLIKLPSSHQSVVGGQLIYRAISFHLSPRRHLARAFPQHDTLVLLRHRHSIVSLLSASQFGAVFRRSWNRYAIV